MSCGKGSISGIESIDVGGVGGQADAALGLPGTVICG